jgi:hypothetical protein
VKYLLPSQVIKSYKDLLYPEKTTNLNYSIVDKSKIKWSAITDPLGSEEIAAILASYSTNLSEIDEIFCDSAGSIKSEFLIAAGQEPLKKSTAIAPEKNACFVSTDVLMNINKLNTETKERLVSGSKGTGCQVTVLYYSISAGRPFKFAILDKANVVKDFKSPVQMTLNRLKSVSYSGQCAFPSGIEALKNIVP